MTKEGEKFLDKIFNIDRKLIHKKGGGKGEQLGELKLFSNHRVILNRLKVNLLLQLMKVGELLLFVLAMYFVIKTIVVNQLKELTQSINDIDLENIKKIEEKTKVHDEIWEIKYGFNVVLEKLIEKEKIDKQKNEEINKRNEALQSIQDQVKILFQKSKSTLAETNKQESENISTLYDGKDRIKQCKDMLISLSQNTERLNEANSKLSGIYSLIAKIEKQSSKINSILSESRLLSFNAEIEAAHAGKFGKGFSIVAQEMATFAQMVTELSNENRRILKDSSNEITHILSSLEEVVGQTRENTNESLINFEQIEGQFGKIEDGIEKTKELNQKNNDNFEDLIKVVEKAS